MTPARRLTFGVAELGADRSIKTLAPFTWLGGPGLRTPSTTVDGLTPRATVPALQPVTVTVHVAPLAVGVPTTQPVAVPVRRMSPAARPLTAPPKVIFQVSDDDLVGEPGARS